MSEKLIRGISCPSCGGSLEISEGTLLLQCKFCNTGLFVRGDRGISRFYVPIRITREDFLARMRKWFGGINKAPDLKQEAKFTESFPVFIPFWRVNATVVGWVLGDEKKGSGKDQKWVPVEKKVNRKFEFTCPACEIGEFGVRWVDLHGDEIRPFDLEEVQKQGMTFAVMTTPTDVLQACEADFMQQAAKSSGVDRVTFEKLFQVNQTYSIVFYPLWVLRYEYKNRIYQLVGDAESGNLLYGRAPGNNLYRVAVLLLCVMTGNFILTSYLRAPDSDDGFGILIICALIMLFGFWKFRYGGEVKIEQKSKPGSSFEQYLPDLSRIQTDLKSILRKT